MRSTFPSPSAWRALPYAAGFSDYANGYQTGQYRKVGDMVQVRGMIKKATSAVANETMFTMPVTYRPLAQLFFILGSGQYSGGIVALSGEITTAGLCWWSNTSGVSWTGAFLGLDFQYAVT